MALVAMGVIAVTSALAIRSVTLGDRVGSNIRSQQLAMYAAEVALRWCEADVLRGTVSVPIDTNNEASPNAASGSNENWRVLANWNGPWAITVPGALLPIQTGNNSVLPFNIYPQCMAQKVSVVGPVDEQGRPVAFVVQITARGFSPDYTPRTANNSGAGGEVWLQSILKDYNHRQPL
jgi:type II secretory pathway pseudopilin PulG